MELTVQRFGALETFYITEPIPAELNDFPWPPDVAAAVVAADDAWVRLNAAQDEWGDAHDLMEHHAPKQDDDALRAALRADKPDPGTPHTDAAKRAEHVAWTALSVAREDCEPLLEAGKVAVNQYLQTHSADLAQYELERLAEYRAAHVKLTSAQSAADAALGQVGNASRIMGFYIAGRWGDSETIALTWYGDDRRMLNFGQHNDDLEAKWTALATTGTEPAVIDVRDQKADDLALAIRLGINGPEAKAELKRRRMASRKAATPA